MAIRRKIPNFLRVKVEILSPNCALESLWIIFCVLLTLQDLLPSQMPTGDHIVHVPGNLSSTMLSEKPWTLLTIFWTRDPTAIELSEVLSKFSLLYSWRQFCCRNDKLKSPKMHCNITVWGCFWLCFSNVAPLDFRLNFNLSERVKHSNPEKHTITGLLPAISSHVLISDKAWDNAVSLVLSHNISSAFPAAQGLLH